jgi:hypothetical protein
MLKATWVNGQDKIIFVNPSQGKLVEAKNGDFLMIRYKGYMSQQEFYKQTLVNIGDSSVILGIPGIGGGILPKGENPYKEIRYIDIEAFRIRKPGVTIAKNLLGIGAAVGSILVLDRLYERGESSTLTNLAISAAVGISINIGLNLIFPEKPKYKTNEGWHIESVRNNP